MILHYIHSGIAQQNVQMNFNSSTGRWEFSINDLSPGQVLQYSFTYQQSGLQHDSSGFSWTHP